MNAVPFDLSVQQQLLPACVVLVMIANANLPLSIVLTAISSLFAFVTVPLLVAGSAFLLADLDQPVRLPVGATLVQLLVLIVLPVGLGMALRGRWPEPVLRWLKPLQKGGQILLYVCVVLLVLESLDTVKQFAGDAVPWSVLLCVLNLWLCFCLARASGFNAQDSVTIALEGPIRNLAVALLIAVNVLERCGCVYWGFRKPFVPVLCQSGRYNWVLKLLQTQTLPPA